ncbi:MAG: COR domain-containing protein [Cyanobacteria bacterium J06614_10]
MNKVPQWANEKINNVIKKQLDSLDLDGANQEDLLFEIPTEVFQLNWLKRLNLSNNQLTTISPEILCLKNLTELNIDNNPIEMPPEVMSEGVASIKAYVQQLEKAEVDYLYEAKLLIVGEGGAGKTSLARSILSSDTALRSDTSSTSGINILPWYFSLENGKKFRVNMWDFGGQEIYHATHQFFLTKRSLYLLVVDTRRENSDIYYWLSVISMYGEDSPILIIKNEKQDRSCEINERQLRGEFINLKATLSTNLATGRGLTEIIEQIKHSIKQLPYGAVQLPKAWVTIRQVLEQEPRDYITLDEYVDICCENGLNHLQEQLQLSKYLHELGIILHFQEDPILKKIIIIKPTWATTAIYQLLDSPVVVNNSGWFNRATTGEIWSNQQYSIMQEELLQLMVKFKLCYKIADESESYVFPQLLPSIQPEYDWETKDNLSLRYEYEFMPKGILSQLIINLHSLIPKQHVWRNGVLLSKDQALAEVVENYHRREIVIRVGGISKRDFLSVITYEIDKINSSYKQIKYKKLVPCNCQTCANSASPYFYDLNFLLKGAERQLSSIQCLISYEDVSISGILHSVLDERELLLVESNKTPISIVNQNAVETRNYIEQMNTQGSALLHEAKILLVGEPDAGKTTLMRKLIDPQHKVPAKESSTLGINVCSWQFPFPKNIDIVFNASIWDFGGQEIQYTLHHFFLTPQSLYVLLVDDRRQHTEFDYWFNIIRILGGNSSILVVLNEKNYKSITNFSLKTYSERYPELNIERRDVDFSVEDGRLEGLSRKIQEMLSNLEHVGDELPAKWILIRTELEQLKGRNYISVEEYFRICDSHGIKEEDKKLLLSKYLHNLGVLLHFQDDSSLSNTIFLNPQWVVHGIYTILSDKQIEKNNGRFSKTWLFKLWTTKGYSFQEKNLLLNLMRKDNLDLCYQMNFSHKDEYIFPQLLPAEKPDYEWNDKHNLEFRFQYPFMPKGIIPHLIVRLSSFISKNNLDTDLVWQKGVVFIKNDDIRNKKDIDEEELTKAEVIEGINKDGIRSINIRISGLDQEKKELLAIIRKELFDIHKRFGNILFHQKIPCNCEACLASMNPHFFDYDYEIVRRLQAKVYFIDCGKSFQKVEIPRLIHNVIGDSKKNLVSEKDRIANTISVNPTFNLTQLQGQSTISKDDYSMSNINQFGDGDNIAGDKVMRDKIGTQINNSQNLAQAAQDIKELLNQLSKEYPNNSAIVGAKAIEVIDSKPALKKRVINALKEAGSTALEKLVDHPAVSIVVAGAKGFTND